ncbi:MAG: hypothetical protein HRT89_09245, partial [Lentisphaeria bacterium]|nr:hypothetical protein [Lentisphaeria bacterium]
MTLSDLEKEFNTGSMARDSWLGRFHSEIKYAEGLCDIHPGKASKWRKLISQACAIVGSAANKSTGNYKSAVKKAEAVLEPIAKVAKTYHVHCIGHGHIDMNWRWSWQETVAVTNDTFTTALRLMDEFPDFRYSQSQSAVYALIKQYNPELMDRIREKIKSGQWEHTASHWVEGDKNMAGTEAMCRQVLYARQFAKDEFGLEPEDVPVDWQPDSFGHSHGVPGYLNESGIKYYYFTRLGTIGPCPPVFHWKGLNGSTVLAHHAETYNGYMTSAFIGKFITYSKESGLKNFCHSYGVGNHGGGPTRTNILAIYEMDSWPVFPNMKMSTAKNYFESIEAEKVDIPTIDRELNYFAQGCYTSNDRIKRWNRIAESRLPDAEAAATLDWALLGSSYPTASLTKAWQDTLFGHFHDILPGCNQDISQDYTSGKFQETMATTAMVETNALRRIAAEVDTSGDDVVLEPNTPALYRRESAGNGAGFGSEEGMISQYETVQKKLLKHGYEQYEI